MKAKRSPCPIACSLDLLGDRWTLLVIRDLFAGHTHFKDFLRSPEGIATNILTNRLERLGAAGLVRARASRDRAGAHAYFLTPKGRALYPVLESLRDWGLKHLRGTAALVEVPPPKP